MSVDKRDSALSEVIGMILIIAILVVAMSVYITYMVPERGKAAEIRHMNDVRGSFLELSYLIDSLWINGQAGITTSVPIRLHSVSEPMIIPMFTPISSQGQITITDVSTTTDTFNVTFFGFNEQRAFVNPPPPDPVDFGVSTTVNRDPYRVLLNFTPLITNTIPKQGGLATLKGDNNGVNFSVEFQIRNFLRETNIAATFSGDEIIVDNTRNSYRHALIAIDLLSGLEYVVVQDLTQSINPAINPDGRVTVDIKPVLDLFPRANLVKGSTIMFQALGGNILAPCDISDSAILAGPLSCDLNLTFLYGLKYGEDITDADTVDIIALSPLSSVQFSSHNYYWVNQVYRYQKGAVFLLQDSVLRQDPVVGRINSTPLSDVQINVYNLTPGDPYRAVTIADVDIRQKQGSRLSSSGGSAQIVADVSVIDGTLKDTAGYWHNVSDGTVDRIEIAVESDDIDVLRMWYYMFTRVCSFDDVCDVQSPLNSGQVTLIVSNLPDERLVVQYTKVGLLMEIRP